MVTRQIVNKFAGTCFVCRSHVRAGEGYAQLLDGSPPWKTVCLDCTQAPADEDASDENVVSEPKARSTKVAAPKAEARTYALTEEQQAAVDAFALGESIAIQAGAGTGKTSTLVAIAESTKRIGQYVAFNRAIVKDAQAKLPKNVNAATAHSLAFRQVGVLYKNRLESQRQSSDQIARILGIKYVQYEDPTTGATKTLQPAFLASHVMKAIITFCNTADDAVSKKHFHYIDGLDGVDESGTRQHVVNDKVRDYLFPFLKDAWADIVTVTGQLRFSHDCYLKIWELGLHGDPVIPGDFILFDEAQDASPVLLSVVEQQERQVVFVGDGQQAIYEWRGAVDAMDTVDAERTLYLTNSFRFGPAVAEAANKILSNIDSAKLRLVGLGATSKLEVVDEPSAILCRTNAGALGALLGAISQGQQPYLVGGENGELERFAKGALELQLKGSTKHPELCIFDSWAAVQAYVADDPQGSELALLVRLIDQNSAQTILDALRRTVPEAEADVVISTAHRSKGREWDSVQIQGDWAPVLTNDSELRLAYVAVTRAKRVLDVSLCSAITDLLGRSIGYDDDYDEEGE